MSYRGGRAAKGSRLGHVVSFNLIAAHLNLLLVESRMSPSVRFHGSHLVEVSCTIQVEALGSYLKPGAMRSASFVA